MSNQFRETNVTDRLLIWLFAVIILLFFSFGWWRASPGKSYQIGTRSADSFGGIESAATAYTGTLLITSQQTISGDSITMTGSVQCVDTGTTLFGSSNVSGTTIWFNGFFLDPGPIHVFETGVTIRFAEGSVEFVRSEWWGIDGTADEVEINKAILSLPKGVVQLSASDYSITSSIYMGEYITLQGRGIANTNIISSVSGSLTGGAIRSEVGNITIKDLCVTGPGDGIGGSDRAIRISSEVSPYGSVVNENALIENVKATGWASYGIQTVHFRKVSIRNCEITGNGWGIILGRLANPQRGNSEIRNCRITDNTLGNAIDINQSSVIVTDNIVTGNGTNATDWDNFGIMAWMDSSYGSGYFFGNGTPIPIDGLIIKNNIVRDNKLNGIYMSLFSSEGVKGVIISGNHIDGNGITTHGTPRGRSRCGVVIEYPAVVGPSLTDDYDYEDLCGVIIDSNVIHDHPEKGISIHRFPGVSITNNIISGCTSDGIYMYPEDSTMVYATVLDNVFLDITAYDVQFATTNRDRIIHARVEGNVPSKANWFYADTEPNLYSRVNSGDTTYRTYQYIQELVSNGTFEVNITGTTNWSSGGGLGGCSTFERNTVSPITGTGDLHAVDDTAFKVAYAITAKPNHIYVCNFKVSGTSGLGQFTNSFSTNLTGTSEMAGVVAVNYSAQISGTTPHEYFAVFDVSSLQEGYVYWSMSGTTGEVYMDDISLKEYKIIDATNPMLEEDIIVVDGTLSQWGTSRLNSADSGVTSYLPSGSYIGQIKTIVMIDATNCSGVTIIHHQTSDPEIAVFDAVDETGVFLWTGTEWITLFATCTF